MSEPPDIVDLLSRNRRVDPGRLAESREMLRRLREQGVRRKEYDLVPPFGGRRVSVQDDEDFQPLPIRTGGM